MYLFRNYVYICSRLKLNISPMHQINHGQVSLLLRIKTTKPGRIPGDVGGCHCQPGVERQSSDGLKTPAVHLFRKVELLFSEIKTTNKHTLYLSILVPPHDLCKKYTKKCVLSKKKIAKTGLNYACFMLKSTPARKKYSTAGCVVVTNINYAKLNQARSQDQG